MPPGHHHQFGPFHLDASARVLFRDRVPVALTPKAVDVLIVLVQAAGRPVGRDELLQAVWAGTVVEEGSLTSHISFLRKALGEGFIETLPKRGYRFVGQVAQHAPSRTLTFLFTGIEEAAREPGAIERHDALLREATARHGRRALRIEEDASCTAFADARCAIQAAVDVQRALSAASINVRVGLHSGTVEDGDDNDLGGPTQARAARVMAAARGGQILLSAATVAVLERVAPPGGEWRDLGDHTLRGFARPERLYQLTVAGLRSEFAPIRTQEAMRTNLPPSLTAFIGRQRALAETCEQVQQCRMVTLVGAGGTGKTRLSLEAARRLVAAFPDGVWFVELAALIDAGLIARAIANVLGARSEGDTSPVSLIEGRLREQRVLLVLDNCEHVIDEAAKLVQTLLRALPELHVLATSREALGTEGEAVYRVPSLTMPAVADSMAPPDVIASEAGQFFIDRARAVRSDFVMTERNAAAVARVCQRLDGIPLAIELAAARLTALSVEEIARRIDDRFHLLTGGLRTALPRQRTLRALVDWSYELLGPGERAMLNALSVFAGSFSLEAAERVAADESQGDGTLDAIELLVAKSLVIADTQDGAGTRYRLLETIRQYASEKLVASWLADTVRWRHFEYFADLAESGAKALVGPTALEWLDRLEAEHDNLRAAMDRPDTDARDYARLAGTLRTFWEVRCHYSEASARLERACAVHAARDHIRLDALIGAGLVAFRLAEARRSDDRLAQAIALAQELGDTRGEAEATMWLGHAHRPLGAAAAEPILLHALSLATKCGDRWLETFVRVELGRTAMMRGQHAEARRVFMDCARSFGDIGCVIDGPSTLLNAGQCALEQLDFATARRLLEDSLVQHRRIGWLHQAADTLVLLGQLALNEQRLDEARALTAESLRVYRALHDPKCTARGAVFLANVLRALGDDAAALSHAESAAATYRELDLSLPLARALCTVGCIHATLGQRDAAQHTLFSGLFQQQRAYRDTHLPALLEAIAGMHPHAPDAARLLGAAQALREQLNVPLQPSDRAEHDRWHADVRAKHGPAAFDRAVALGRGMTRDDAIRTAMALRPSSSGARAPSGGGLPPEGFE